MLIHPWDAALDPAEWQDWLASRESFGVLADRERITTALERRGRGLDAGAAAQQRRRLSRTTKHS